MQFKLSALTALALTTLAVATPLRRDQCDTGSIQCCQSVQSPTSSAVSAIFALLGIDAQDVTALVGLTCSPVTVIGAGSNSCTAQPACCTDNSFHGLVALGCTPISL
ncbi:Fruiting body protein SC3 [Psilocybe cubensis]|uniref:Fruiting body protein SC3 n=2 Tax=Psilocybe cubensis TaxID=181762 RepID=A0ACB8H5Q6_PSICU|nr:Fruiting body protein SC3 [Psilocybe cubensis]KAH9482524.1 Fruiting body protein SC3 [Psilocybe cubensis]